MKLYQVYIGKVKPVYLGKARGKTFRQACVGKARRDRAFRAYYDEKSNTYAGQRLYSGAHVNVSDIHS